MKRFIIPTLTTRATVRLLSDVDKKIVDDCIALRLIITLILY